MALQVLENPLCLIESGSDGVPAINPVVVEELSKLDKPCVVVGIAGAYRTGKSYLMNRLAGHSTGFATASTIQGLTKGIWVWARQHPLDPSLYLLLLDTEGLGDAEKGDTHHDNMIFCLTTLLSSMLVYNTVGVINEEELGKLFFITEMSNHIKTHNTEEGEAPIDDSYFDWYFPIFVFALRDFTLQKVIEGREVTSNEYMENCLKLKQGDNEKAQKFNAPRMCIRKYFRKRHCFTFDVPASRRKLPNLGNLPDDTLSEDFVEEVKEFVTFVHQEAPVKKLDHGQTINGRMLASLATAYVDAIRGGSVPCIENAVISMAAKENTRAVVEGVALYKTRMSQTIAMPTDDVTLTEAHLAALQEAVKYFMDRAIFDSDQEYQESLNEKIAEELTMLKQKNEAASEAKCKGALSELHLAIDTKMRQGSYARAGGYGEYQVDLNAMQVAYNSREGLGTKKAAALAQFLEERGAEGEAILAADNKVSEEEAKAEAARQAALQRQRDLEEAERQAASERQHSEEMQRTLQLNQQQLLEQMERERTEIQRHHEEVLQRRLEEQRRLQEEAARQQAAAMQAEIERLKAQPPPPPRRRRRRRDCTIQ